MPAKKKTAPAPAKKKTVAEGEPVPGGKYEVDGQLVNAEGKRIDESGNLLDDE